MELAAYHVQQAAEKHLKALLVEQGVAPPKTHDLTQLISMHSGTPAPSSVDSAAAMTSAYAWLTRYPGSPPITEQHVDQGEQDLLQIKQWVLSLV
ncbi:hypothetical protein BH11ARM2_BH11ARM2_00220 [soil metagenome]